MKLLLIKVGKGDNETRMYTQEGFTPVYFIPANKKTEKSIK